MVFTRDLRMYRFKTNIASYIKYPEPLIYPYKDFGYFYLFSKITGIRFNAFSVELIELNKHLVELEGIFRMVLNK